LTSSACHIIEIYITNARKLPSLREGRYTSDLSLRLRDYKVGYIHAKTGFLSFPPHIHASRDWLVPRLGLKKGFGSEAKSSEVDASRPVRLIPPKRRLLT
jgi:hypothetical protein